MGFLYSSFFIPLPKTTITSLIRALKSYFQTVGATLAFTYTCLLLAIIKSMITRKVAVNGSTLVLCVGLSILTFFGTCIFFPPHPPFTWSLFSAQKPNQKDWHPPDGFILGLWTLILLVFFKTYGVKQLKHIFWVLACLRKRDLNCVIGHVPVCLCDCFELRLCQIQCESVSMRCSKGVHIKEKKMSRSH